MKAKGLSHVVSAANVTAGTVTLNLGSEYVKGTTVIVQVRTAAGAIKAYDGQVVLSEYTITIDNAGAVDWAETDVLNIIVA